MAKMITENYIWSLLRDKHDFPHVIRRLESLGRKKAQGLEEHHIEPERDRVIYLKPLEHLAIHVAHAKLNDTNSNRAKVCAFVRYFPGGFRRLLSVSPDLQEALITFGQGRPENGSKLNSHPNTLAARQKPPSDRKKEAARQNGKKGAEKVRQKLLGREITWGDKISQHIQNLPMCSCIHCGKEMKAWPSSIIQHQRSKKCSDLLKKAK
jgi:hypothetical protein